CLADTEMEPPTKKPTNRVGRSVVGLTAIILVLTAIVQRQSTWWLVQVSAEWHIWLPLVQVVSMTLLHLVVRRPVSRFDWVAVTVCNLVLIGLAAILYFEVETLVFVYTLLFLLRTTISLLWLLAMIGLLAIGWCIVRRRRPGSRTRLILKLAFASFITLIVAEPLAAVVHSSRQTGGTLRLPSFPEAAEDDEVHIAAIGGSTMIGHPYEPKFGIPEVCLWRLQQLYPSKTIVMHNVAIRGLSFEQAVFELKELPRSPDLILVYSGHNEFYHELEELGGATNSVTPRLDRILNHSPLFRLLDEPLSRRNAIKEINARRRLFDRHVAPGNLYAPRLGRFERRIRTFLNFCKSEQIASLWFVPASSESGFEPSRSMLAPGTSDAQQKEVKLRFERSLKWIQSKDYSNAANELQTLVELQPAFAEFQFRYGQCLAALGKWDEAREHFASARDLDGYPTRINADYRAVIRELTREFNRPLIDAPEHLRRHTTHGVLDRTLFHDNVHPTMKTFYLLGIEAANQIRRLRLLPNLDDAKDSETPLLSQAVNDLGVDVEHLALAYERTAYGLKELSALRFDPSDRMTQSRIFSGRASRLRAGSLKPGLEGTEPLE
ncbi:MAG: tetratricopeptide repeat protein, partial [Planctomycetaceae bacterium]